MSAITEAFNTQPPIQTEIRQIPGSPEGEIYAPAGYLVVDTSGELYIKQSDNSLNTGWMKVTTESP